MSKIVVVEPDRMLQRAFMMALFPEHELKMLDELPEAAPKDFAAMIVDLAALRDCGSSTGRDQKLLRRFDWPLLVIEAEDGNRIADRGNLVRIKRPVTKESLQKALAICLTNKAGPTTTLAKTQAPAMKSKPRSAKHKRPGRAEPPRAYIELTEVVEVGDGVSVATLQAQKKI
jgi:hypothetical protein